MNKLIEISLGFTQDYCEAGGYQEGGKPCSKDVTAMAPKEVANLFCRYLLWHVVEGKPGLPSGEGSQGKKKQVSASGRWRQRACCGCCACQGSIAIIAWSHCRLHVSTSKHV